MTKEELFKKNFPEYVTEKGACLSPFWDLFSAGIECATYELNKGCIQTLTKENAELKERADKADLDSVLFFNQLCKAKAIIKDYMIVADHITVCSVPEENRCINVLKLNEQAEQFLNRQGDNEDD
jgi:hypothetical protein